jgi:RNAse (barnase) inhibitor barstar
MARKSKVKIDLSEVTSNEQLHFLLMNNLSFPAWYGKNWDAFWDAITGLVEMPEILEFNAWLELESKLPKEANMLKSCLDEMSQEFPELASVVYYL